MIKFRLRKEPFVIIGIDPDCKKNGVCLYSESVFTLKSLGRIELLAFVKNYPNCVVILENPSANKPTFFRKGTNARTMLRIAQNVGAVKEIANVLYEDLQVLKTNGQIKEVLYVAPLTNYFKNWKNNTAKFIDDTGIKKSNADTRDACALVYNYLTY